MLSLKDISKILNSELINKNINNISSLLTDSRNIDIYSSNTSLFFAISGLQNNGHLFIEDLYTKGVRAFIISENINYSNYPEAGFIKVDNVISALQKLGKYKRELFSIPIIGITGSNGKTIVKEWLNWILSEKFNITRSPQSYNSKIGVPLSLWLLDKKTELGIFEAGISEPGEMENLKHIINPNIGILTNIGEAHQKNFNSIKQKLEEKILLFNNSEIIVYNTDNKTIKESINNKYPNKKAITWSFNNNGDVNVSDIIKHKKKTEFKLIYQNIEYNIKIPYIDKGSIENAISCFCCLLSLNISIDKKILSLFKSLPAVAMRLEIIDGINNSTIINDSYNSDINSLKIALDYLTQKKGNKKAVVILSDILQSSEKEVDLYKNIANYLNSKDISYLIGIGESISKNKYLFKQDARFFKSTHKFLESIKTSDFSDSCILLKGARSYEFERISKKLQKKSHETLIEIDFNLMKSNLNFFKQKLKSSTKVMAVVKAFSYGSGYQEIALFLQHNRIDYLAVAYPDEGVDLRKHGVSTPIMVMNPGKESLPIMLEYNLQPEIYSISQLSEICNQLNKTAVKSFSIHIKFNTGMHRLGLGEKDLPELIKILSSNQKLKIASIFSHLSSAANPDFDNFTFQQIQKLESLYNQICKNLTYKPLKHILNSIGIVRFPEHQYDMVRLGIGLYGILPEISDELAQVSTFKSIISQINHVKKGDCISYNCSGKLNKDSQIATIPVGYADGLDRRLGNGNWEVIVNNKRAKTIGDICMDMSMIDITGLKIKEGDEVIIFGKDNSVCQMAEVLNTIPYEVVTGISERVKRIYLQE